jgi:hypothetical protein
MVRVADPQILREPLPDRPPVPQPDYLRPSAPPDALLADLRGWDPGAMGRLHDDGVLDFVNPRGFGFVKDRRVAGFQRHGMTKVPSSVAAWVVAHVELVGLVVHEEPVVYVSANLPRMDDVRTVPTRPLDPFESEALDALRGGEEVYARGAGGSARMVGAIRATRQCVVCHGGSRGDLLGAFCYGLRRETP